MRVRGDAAPDLTDDRPLTDVGGIVDGEGPDEPEVDVQDAVAGELDEEVLAVGPRLDQLVVCLLYTSPSPRD